MGGEIHRVAAYATAQFGGKAAQGRDPSIIVIGLRVKGDDIEWLDPRTPLPPKADQTKIIALVPNGAPAMLLTTKPGADQPLLDDDGELGYPPDEIAMYLVNRKAKVYSVTMDRAAQKLAQLAEADCRKARIERPVDQD
jgi:hypothetical protein